MNKSSALAVSDRIVESNMSFGPYERGDWIPFRIDGSKTHCAINQSQGVHIADLVLLSEATNSFWIIEAKSSSPHPETFPAFDDFLGEICEKLLNAFNITIASILERHEMAKDELPTQFQKDLIAKCKFRLCLIVNGHQLEWLNDLQDALSKRQELQLVGKTWNLGCNFVKVLNHDLAKERKIISAVHLPQKTKKQPT